METCKYGSGAGTEKPTAERQKGTLYRAYRPTYRKHDLNYGRSWNKKRQSPQGRIKIRSNLSR